MFQEKLLLLLLLLWYVTDAKWILRYRKFVENIAEILGRYLCLLRVGVDVIIWFPAFLTL